MEERVEVRDTDEGWKRGENLGYRRGMEERREVRVETRDGREVGGEGTDERWKRGGR